MGTLDLVSAMGDYRICISVASWGSSIPSMIFDWNYCPDRLDHAPFISCRKLDQRLSDRLNDVLHVHQTVHLRIGDVRRRSSALLSVCHCGYL